MENKKLNEKEDYSFSFERTQKREEELRGFQGIRGFSFNVNKESKRRIKKVE